MPELEAMTRDVVAEQFAKLGGSLDGEPAEPAGDVAGEVEAAPEPEAERAAPTAGRDEKGRFAPKTEKEPAQAADTDPEAPAKPVASASAVPAVSELKPPQDWRAEARAEFSKLPRVVQEEALRLHVETKKGLQELAEARKEAGAWKEATSAYGHVFAGQQPHQVIGNLLRSLSVLQTGHPQQRAQVAAAIVRDYLGTDEGALTLLAQALDVGGAGKPAPQPRQLGPQDLDAWYEQRRQGEARDTAVKTWKDFETANPEFLNEPGFRQRIAIELQVAMDGKSGQPTKEDIQAAYDAACGSHPSVAKIVNQRKEAEAAGKANASTQARTAAAVGIKNEPAVAGSTSEPADTVRDEVKRQYARLSNKRR